MLERADVHFTRGPFGKPHVRYGEAAHTSGPRPPWVPMRDIDPHTVHACLQGGMVRIEGDVQRVGRDLQRCVTCADLGDPTEVALDAQFTGEAAHAGVDSNVGPEVRDQGAQSREDQRQVNVVRGRGRSQPGPVDENGIEGLDGLVERPLTTSGHDLLDQQFPVLAGHAPGCEVRGADQDVQVVCSVLDGEDCLGV